MNVRSPHSDRLKSPIVIFAFFQKRLEQLRTWSAQVNLEIPLWKPDREEVVDYLDQLRKG